MNINEQMQKIADKHDLVLKTIQPKGYSFKNDDFSILWYDASGSIVVRNKGIKQRTVRCVGRHKLDEFISKTISGENKNNSVFITANHAVNALLSGDQVFYIEKSLASSDFSLYEDCKKLTIENFLDGKYAFRMKPKSITINGVEFFSKKKAHDAFTKLWSEMV